MLTKFNTNQSVLVKLTPKGREIVDARYGDGFHKEDSNGWSRFSMWLLLSIFGEHTGLDKDLCFEPDILLDGDS